MAKLDIGSISKVQKLEVDLEKKQKEERVAELGELAELPNGHPAVRALREAKIRYEERKAKEYVVREKKEKRIEIKKARKITPKEKRDAARKSGEREQELTRKVDLLNDHLTDCVKHIDGVMEKVMDTHKELGEIPYLDVKITRLERLLQATRRGLLDARVNYRGRDR